MVLHNMFRLANDPSTPSDILADLASSSLEEIRSSVAANPTSSQKTLLALVGDESRNVIDNLIGNPNIFSGGLVISPCKNITLTLAGVDDAEFILSLRQNEKLNRHVSQVSPSLSDQREWIMNYKKREAIRSEFYFIIRDLNKNPLGTVRVYDFKASSFCWGSWMVAPDSPRKTAIESALSVYEFAFFTLKFNRSHFDVRNDNKKVIDFHVRMGADIINSDEIDTFFTYTKESYEETRNRYTRLLNS